MRRRKPKETCEGELMNGRMGESCWGSERKSNEWSVICVGIEGKKWKINKV